jgi:5-methylcytosine-specific restriction endonuclease McrA
MLHEESLIKFQNACGSFKNLSFKSLYSQWLNGRPHQNTEKDREYVRKRLCALKLRSMDELSTEFFISNIIEVKEHEKQRMFKITLQSGESIICSIYQEFFSPNGWVSISNGLSSTSFLGLNGKVTAGNGGYLVKENLKKDREEGLSVAEMAEKYQCSYHTIRKWLKIFDLRFSREETCFKKGLVPWNKDVTGYTLNLSEEGRAAKGKNVRKGKDCHFWRGGITSERALIGQWTRSIAKDVHLKYNFTCQNCGGSKKLHAHHILPVCTHIERAYDITNLVTVCESCHHDIHKTPESEKKFAEKFLSQDVILKAVFGKNRINRNTPKLKAHFSKVSSIEYFGEYTGFSLDISHQYANFISNGFIVK